MWVVVTIAEEGSLSVVGSKQGRAFRSERVAERQADELREIDGLDVAVILIEEGTFGR